MTYRWDRNSGSTGTSNGYLAIHGGAAHSHESIRRVVLGWSLFALVPAWSLDRLSGRPVYFGAVTQRSSNGSPPPDPSVSPLPNPNYPLERWLWWEASALQPVSSTSYVDPDAMVTLGTIGTMLARDEECSVANTLPSDDLVVYLVVSSPALVNVALEGWAAMYSSVLVSS